MNNFRTRFSSASPVVLVASLLAFSGGMASLVAQPAAVSQARTAITTIPPTDTPTIGLDPRLTTVSRGGRQKSKIFFTRKAGGALSDVTVNYALTGSAINGRDYALLSDSITIPASQTRVALKISPLLSGENRKVKVVVLAGQGYILDAATKKVKVQIVD